MKSYLIYYVFITLSIFLNSCTEGFKEEYSKLVIALTEVTAITTPTTDTTPDYTFSSTGSGALTYGGSCSSSTSIATIGNNTITLNTLSVDTYADCTITVSKTIFTENSEKKLSGSLTITSFTVSSSDDSSSYSSGWQLIARQVDSDNFTDGTHELFDSTSERNPNASSTYLENENDNSSSTFMSIGNLTPSNYVSDGKYKFRLEWDGKTAASLDNKSVTWTQTSWLTDSTVAGFQEIGTSGYVDNSSKRFAGLEKSGIPTSCVIDGNPGGWFHCVGAIVRWGGGIPAPKGTVASSMHLYIWAPEIKETNFALDFDGTNDYVAADNVTSNLDSSTGLPFTVSVWAYPDTAVSGTTACCSKREAIFAFNKTGNSDENLNILYFAQDGSTQKFYHHGSGDNNYTGSSNTFESGQWHHIVMVVDSSGNGKLYINGGQESTWSSGTNTSVNKFSIGQEYDGTGSTASDFFDGKIDEVAIWNVVLSAADVTALYNSGNGLKASANSGNYDNSGDLIGYWKFNEGTGSTLTDNTSNSNNGTLTNMVSSDWVTSGMEL